MPRSCELCIKLLQKIVYTIERVMEQRAREGEGGGEGEEERLIH